MSHTVHSFYGNRLRVRACGILLEGSHLLMVSHKMPSNRDFWAPPGGGIELGEAAEDALKREFREETGLEVVTGKFLFGCEYIASPLHAIELFFEVKPVSGTLKTGEDPEHSEQIIQDVRWMDFAEVKGMDSLAVHGIFRFAETPSALLALRGYFKL